MLQKTTEPEGDYHPQVHRAAHHASYGLQLGNNLLLLGYVPYLLKAYSCLRLENNYHFCSWLRTQLVLDLAHPEADQREVTHLPFPLLGNELHPDRHGDHLVRHKLCLLDNQDNR